MKVRFVFSGGSGRERSSVVDMKSVPRIGELLISGGSVVREVTKVIRTPGTSEQEVVIELGPARAG